MGTGRRSPVAVTLGDPCGIGPEVVARSLAARPALARRTGLVGDRAILLGTFRSLRLRCPPGALTSRFLPMLAK